MGSVIFPGIPDEAFEGFAKNVHRYSILHAGKFEMLRANNNYCSNINSDMNCSFN